MDEESGKEDMALRVSGYEATIQRLREVAMTRDLATDPSSGRNRKKYAVGMDSTG